MPPSLYLLSPTLSSSSLLIVPIVLISCHYLFSQSPFSLFSRSSFPLCPYLLSLPLYSSCFPSFICPLFLLSSLSHSTHSFHEVYLSHILLSVTYFLWMSGRAQLTLSFFLALSSISSHLTPTLHIVAMRSVFPKFSFPSFTFSCGCQT